MTDLDRRKTTIPEPGPAVIVVSRRTVVALGLIIGLSMALALAGVVWIAFRVNSLQQQDIERNSRAIHRIEQLEAPATPAELQAAVLRALRSCADDAECRALFRQVARDAPGR